MNDILSVASSELGLKNSINWLHNFLNNLNPIDLFICNLRQVLPFCNCIIRRRSRLQKNHYWSFWEFFFFFFDNIIAYLRRQNYRSIIQSFIYFLMIFSSKVWAFLIENIDGFWIEVHSDSIFNREFIFFIFFIVIEY